MNAQISVKDLVLAKEKKEWFVADRFGMFIHWGLYALGARHEWLKNREEISTEDYQKYFDNFDPDLYDPADWARRAAEAGMKYVVLTSKHHEGFCLFDTKVTDYKATNTPYGRDLVKPFVEAFRAEGLKVGFYYSLLDWHHPDFPIDVHHPQRNHPDVARLNEGRDITRLPTHEIARLRIAQSPEGRRIFPRMTVYENLQMGAALDNQRYFDEDVKRIFELFPRLEERKTQHGVRRVPLDRLLLILPRPFRERALAQSHGRTRDQPQHRRQYPRSPHAVPSAELDTRPGAERPPQQKIPEPAALCPPAPRRINPSTWSPGTRRWS